MNNNVQIFKTRNVKTPKRNRYDAGTDFFVPVFDEQFIADFKAKNPTIDFSEDENGKFMFVIPGNQVNIPSGIRVHIEDWNTYWDAENKSGVATKKELLVGAQVVDATYSGEVHINVHNVGNQGQKIYENDKLVQFLQKEYRDTNIIVIDDQETFESLEWPGDRGDKGFGEGTGNN